MTIQIRKISLNHFLISISILLSIISTSSIFGLYINITYLEILQCVIAVGMIIQLKNTPLQRMYLFIGAVLIGLISCINYSESFSDVVRFIVLILAFTVIAQYEKESNVNAVEILYKQLVVLISLSDIVYVLVEILHANIPYTMFSRAWTHTYRNYLFVYVARADILKDSFLGMSLVRNCGFFTEPGMYCLFISVALIINLFFLNNRPKWEKILLILTAITTTSTTGLLVILIALLLHIIAYGYKVNKLLVFLLSIFALIIVVFVARDLLESKILNHLHSYNTRLFDLIGGLRLFIKKPIFGWGLKNDEIFTRTAKLYAYGNQSSSNGITSILYQLGIAGIVLYCYPVIEYIKKRQKLNPEWKRVYIILGLVLLLLVSSQPIQYMSFGLALLCYFFINGVGEGREKI